MEGDYDITKKPKILIISLLCIVLYLIVGIIFYVYVENFTLLEAIYLISLTLTTVGYGNKVPITNSGKIFTSFYVLIGIGFICFAISILSGYYVHKSEQMMLKLLKDRKIGIDIEADIRKVLINCFILVIIFIIGIIFFVFYENFTLIDAFYMSCITLTTIGLGDVSPKTDGGKIFALFWIFSGTLCFAKLIADYSNYFINKKQQKMYDNIIKRSSSDIDDLEEMDFDKNGNVSKYEYVLGMLLKIGSIKENRIYRIMEQFDNIEKNGDDTITLNIKKQDPGIEIHGIELSTMFADEETKVEVPFTVVPTDDDQSVII